MTEMERLTERLFGDPNRKVRNINVFWGPEAHKLTTEQRAAEMNKALDQIERGDFELVENLDGDLETTPWDAPFEVSKNNWPKASKPAVDVREWLAARYKEND